MFGLGANEILVLLFVLATPIAVWLLVMRAIARAAKNGAQAALDSAARPAAPLRYNRPISGPAVPSADDVDARQTIVARLTQRFCPQCRAPLAADAPEGLCPACLMAGGLDSALIDPSAGGMAVTTPPSGSQPPAAGEWADLQQHFPQLEILELLGRGGMGTVYKVRQKNLDRIIALKVIPPDAAKDPAFAERFARESRAMARMNHPNIVTVYDSGHEGELYWLMMEYVDGVNLRHALRASHLAPREALAIVPQVCDALQYAHDQGVVHRDIKPENVLLDRSGRVKIADFGLAKLLGKGPDDFTLTRTQQIMGTPRYMAPEQIERPTTVDHRADIYSLGVVLYEMLTGELPLGRFDPPSHKVQVDVRIDHVVLRALEKSPDRRYQRASEIKTELASAASWPASALPSPLAGEGSGVRGPGSAAPAWHTPGPASKDQPTDYPGHHGGPALGLLLAVALGMVLGVLLMAGGLAMAVLALLGVLPSPLGGWLGAAFGCVVGGFGSAAGSYNTYRQMAGAEDLFRSPRTTWFDWVIRGYFLVGIGLLAAGFYFIDPVYTEQTGKSLLTLGGIATFQAGLFLILRLLMRQSIDALPVDRQREARPAKPVDPARESVRRRVAGPGSGLMIAGLLGIFFPIILAVLAILGWKLAPLPSKLANREPLEFLDGINTPPEAPLASPAFLPLVAAPAPLGTLAIARPAAAVPVLVAQGGTTPVMGMWALIVMLWMILNLAFSVLLIVGGWRMRQAKSYGLSMMAAILALLPCSFGWIVGLPMGIWALIVLLDPEVREGFEG